MQVYARSLCLALALAVVGCDDDDSGGGDEAMETGAMETGGSETGDSETGDSGAESSEPGEADRASAILALTGDATAGQAIFENTMMYGCNSSGCHGTDGVSGSASPGLDESVPATSDEGLVESLLNGKNIMPAFGERLDDQQIADVLAYVKSLVPA